MPDSRSKDMMQRIQIGLTGLAGVVLLVGLANIVIEKAAVDEQAVAPAVDGAPPALVPPGANMTAPAPEPRPEPLAELGVTPAVPEKPDANGAGQVVPDLEPNPALNKPMDREP
jgi:hypothetical protein